MTSAHRRHRGEHGLPTAARVRVRRKRRPRAAVDKPAQRFTTRFSAIVDD